MGKQGNLHGSLPWALRTVEGVEAEIKGTWIIPHWQPPLSSWFGIGGEGENCRVGVWGWMEIRQSNPSFFSNLYPPLTPVPPCVAEIRAIGQSPIHCHPEYFKVKLHRLTKVLLIKGLLSLLSPFSSLLHSLPRICCRSSCALLSMVHCFVFTLRKEGGGEAESFLEVPQFPFFDLMKFGVGSDCVILWANWKKSQWHLALCWALWLGDVLFLHYFHEGIIFAYLTFIFPAIFSSSF